MRNCFFLLILALGFCSCNPNLTYEDYPTLYRNGDDPSWAKKDLDEKGWLVENTNTGKEIFWVRIKVNLKKEPMGKLGIKVDAFGAFDVYWDGKLIGHNGSVMSPSTLEVPGTATSYFYIPDSVDQIGSHVVALRVSQTHLSHVKRGTIVGLGNYERLLKAPLIITSFMNLLAGAFLIAAIYYLFIYLNSKRKQYAVLIFSICCFLFFSLLILEYIKFYIAIPYTRFYVRLEAIGWLTFAISMLIPLYFSIQFQFKWKKIIMALLFIALLSIYKINYGHYDLTAFYYALTMWCFSLVIVFNAIYQKQKGVIVVLIGLLASAIVYQYVYYDFTLFISFSFVVLAMLYLHSIKMKLIEEEHQSSLLLSSRLQLELIKKNIQPHFIKNTLTSLIDWVEESPKEGVAFIEALAEEFDIMNSIADQTLIPIRQEIELCKKHLVVMRFRKEINYLWEEEGIDEIELIPPALFHTLIENGITHSIALPDGSLRFKLSFSRKKQYKQYEFQTIATNRVKSNDRQGGTGFLYIKSRLSESYGEAWDFSSKENQQGWITTLKIYTK